MGISYCSSGVCSSDLLAFLEIRRERAQMFRQIVLPHLVRWIEMRVGVDDRPARDAADRGGRRRGRDVVESHRFSSAFRRVGTDTLDERYKILNIAIKFQIANFLKSFAVQEISDRQRGRWPAKIGRASCRERVWQYV